VTPRRLPPAELIEALRSTPSLIREATRNADDSALGMRPVKDEWSANEVLAHLRSCADVWGDYIERIVKEDEPTIRAVSPRTWIEQTDYNEQPFARSFGAFARQRKKLLTTLSALDDADWERTALVTGAGKASTRTVLDYVERLVRHERPHVKQIARARRGDHLP
jgi:hypothetical protein